MNVKAHHAASYSLLLYLIIDDIVISIYYLNVLKRQIALDALLRKLSQIETKMKILRTYHGFEICLISSKVM